MSKNNQRKYKFNTIVPGIDSISNENSVISQGENTEGKLCRICLDNDSQEKKFISPCRCRGSLKYIHEECLKTWLVSQDENLDSRKCELCNTELLMEVKIERKCTPTKIVREGLSTCFFIPISVSITMILLYLSYLILVEILENGVEALSLIVFVICVLSGISLFGLFMFSIVEECVTTGMMKWSIFDQEFCDDKQEEDNSNSSVSEHQVMFIPPTVTVKGRRVKTPVLFPTLQPLYKGSQRVAYITPSSRTLKNIMSEPIHSIKSVIS